ncbi:MAG: class I mannose-6-phosphate isomerase [Anaerolineae bacterium]|nr:class I mannose-6-phosphate isomerase [Phycisphaerae bacterium]
MSLYPLKFKPRFVEKIWGGRKLETIVGKKLPSDKPFGESWELYDFPPGVVENSKDWVSAAVANGPLAGKTLHELVLEYGEALHGDVRLVGEHGQFPILIKFLDAREDLSVQVHPPAEYADTHPGAHLKTEAWYVMQHEPQSRILKGLVPGVSREQFEAEIDAGTVDRLIKSITVKEGDCHFLPSGTVHALGAGILAAEVQTPSDTTFRVFDFNRLENGKPRKLHVDEALECIDFSGRPEEKQPRSHVAGYFTTVTRLVKCPFFQIEKVRMTEGVEEPVPYDEPVVWMMLSGEATVRVDGIKEPTTIRRGETVLLPAQMKNPIIKTTQDCQWLEVTFPTG